MEKVEEYYFKATHKRMEESVCRNFEYTKIFRIIPMGKNEQAIFRIEVSEADVAFDRKYKKMEDIYRRLQYLYSGIVVRLNSNRQVIFIENSGELKQNWMKRKQYILKDYSGSSIAHYMDRITADFNDEHFFITLFGQYKDFGLFFPNVPAMHTDRYMGERTTTIQNAGTLTMLEKTCFEKIENELRRYVLSAVTTEESRVPLHAYEGTMFYAVDKPLLKKTTLSLSYGNKWTNEWNFHLSRIE